MLASSQPTSDENSPIRIPGSITPGLSPAMTQNQNTACINTLNASSRLQVHNDTVRKAF